MSAGNPDRPRDADMTMQAPARLTVLRLPDVIKMVGMQRTQIYSLMSRGRFPQSLQLSERAIGWLEHEVQAHLRALAAQRSAPVTPLARRCDTQGRSWPRPVCGWPAPGVRRPTAPTEPRAVNAKEVLR